MEQWGEHDGDFNVIDFYNNVHEHIARNVKTRWYRELFAWFN